MLLYPWSHNDIPYSESGEDGWSYHDLVSMCRGIDLSTLEDKCFTVDCISEKLSAWETIEAWERTLKERLESQDHQADNNALMLENNELHRQLSELRAQVSRLTIQILRGIR